MYHTPRPLRGVFLPKPHGSCLCSRIVFTKISAPPVRRRLSSRRANFFIIPKSAAAKDLIPFCHPERARRSRASRRISESITQKRKNRKKPIFSQKLTCYNAIFVIKYIHQRAGKRHNGRSAARGAFYGRLGRLFTGAYSFSFSRRLLQKRTGRGRCKIQKR